MLENIGTNSFNQLCSCGNARDVMLTERLIPVDMQRLSTAWKD